MLFLLRHRALRVDALAYGMHGPAKIVIVHGLKKIIMHPEPERLLHVAEIIEFAGNNEMYV